MDFQTTKLFKMPVNGKHQNAKMPTDPTKKAKRRRDVKISKNIIFSKSWNIITSKMPKRQNLKMPQIGNHRHAKMSAKCRIHKRQKNISKNTI